MSLTIKQVAKDGREVRIASGKQDAVLTIPAYEEGDRLVFAAEPKQYIWVNLAAGVTESMLYLPEGEFAFPIPMGEALRGFAPGTFSGEQTVSVRAAQISIRWAFGHGPSQATPPMSVSSHGLEWDFGMMSRPPRWKSAMMCRSWHPGRRFAAHFRSGFSLDKQAGIRYAEYKKFLEEE